MSKSCLLALLSVVVALPMVAQQANTPGVASLVINGVGATAPGPHGATVASASVVTTTFVFSGPANTPWALIAADPALGGVAGPAAGGSFPPIGQLDVGPIGPALSVPIDGISPPNALIAALARTGAAGTSSYPFTFTTSASCPFVTTNVQGLMTTVGPPGFLLTTAFSIGSQIPDVAPVPVAGAGDDTTANFSFAACGTFPFYGTAHTSYFVNSNGHISFGAGNTDFSVTQAEFNSGPARTGFWNDFNVLTGGTLTKFDTGAAVMVAWTGVPEFGLPANLCTFDLVLVMGGSGAMAHNYTGPMTTTHPGGVGIVGITPGGLLGAPVTIFGPLPNPLDRISTHLGLPPAPPTYVGAAAMESLNEVFDSPATPAAGLFNLVGLSVNFAPAGAPGWWMF